LIWTIADSKKISKKIKDLISDPNQRIFVSTISFWEVSLKSSIGKMEIAGLQPENLPVICSKIGFDILEPTAADSCSYRPLNASHHKDPFDRMLICKRSGTILF
jgi:PIN domain nuclease of toxin-antitoxin system